MSSVDGLDTSLVDRRLMEYPLMGTLAEVSTVQRAQHGSAEKAAAAVDVAELDAAVAKLTKEGQLRFLRTGAQLLSILQTAKVDFYGLGERCCSGPRGCRDVACVGDYVRSSEVHCLFKCATLANQGMQ